MSFFLRRASLGHSCSLAYYLLFLLLPTACGDSQQQLAKLPDDAVILAFGDSLTFGTGAKKNESYPAILETLVNRKVINAGVLGELSIHGLQRLPKFLDKHQPDLLILCHGGNDILKKYDLAETEKNIRQMITLAKNKNISTILLGVPKLGLFLKSAKLYTNIAESSDVIFIPNLIADVLSNTSMKSDIVHPNKMGYQEIASSLASALRDAGAL